MRPIEQIKHVKIWTSRHSCSDTLLTNGPMFTLFPCAAAMLESDPFSMHFDTMLFRAQEVPENIDVAATTKLACLSDTMDGDHSNHITPFKSTITPNSINFKNVLPGPPCT
jgi:hypothetical protein